MNTNIKLSVCVVTYNQEKYIAQCLQSLVDQETNFKYKVFVSDDCSTDRTQEVIIEFANKYPEIIIPIFHEKNLGAYENYLYVHQQADSKYIAHVDGDDYALPGKLQIQVDFLDRNPMCNILWTPVFIELSSGKLIEQNEYFRSKVFNKKYSRSDLIKYGTLGANSSKMYRESFRDFSRPDFKMIDYFFNIEQVSDGFACFSGDKPLGVYRVGIGIASQNFDTRKILLKSIEYFYFKYPEYKLQANIAALSLLLSDLKNRRETVLQSLKIFIKTYHFCSFLYLIKELKFIKSINVR